MSSKRLFKPLFAYAPFIPIPPQKGLAMELEMTNLVLWDKIPPATWNPFQSRENVKMGKDFNPEISQPLQNLPL